MFGAFRLNPDERLLLREGTPVNLTPRVFETLMLLVERRGRLLPRAEMLQALWPDTHVEENALTKNISELRRALGCGNFVETVSKTGYRFVADVEETESIEETVAAETVAPVEIRPAPAKEPPATQALRNRRLWLAAAALVLLTGGLWRWASPAAPQRGKIETLVILPFRPMSAQQRDEFLELGIADTLIARLNATGEMMVRPASAVRRYTAVDRDAVTIGRELRVDAVLDGSLQTLDSSVRVTARLIRVRDGALLWSGSLDDKFADLFSLQDQLARQVAGALHLALTVPQQERLTKRDTGDLEAFVAYQKGRFFAARRTAEGFSKAIGYYQLALAKDPRYAPAWSGMADAYMLGAWYDASPNRPAHLRAREAALRAIALDGSLAEAHTSLALVHENAEWAFAEADQEYRKALELNPNYTTAHHWYGEFLGLMGHPDDGLAHLRRAQQLDPVSLIIGADTAKLLIDARRYDEAIVECQRTIEMDKTFRPAHGWLALAYMRKGMYGEAQDEFAKQLDTRETESELLGWAELYAQFHMQERAADFARRFLLLADPGHTPAWMMAQMYLSVRLDKEKALLWLQKAYDDHEFYLSTLRVSSEFDPIRADRRFQNLLSRMNFPR